MHVQIDVIMSQACFPTDNAHDVRPIVDEFRCVTARQVCEIGRKKKTESFEKFCTGVEIREQMSRSLKFIAHIY